jgi:hypothetical protein
MDAKKARRLQGRVPVWNVWRHRMKHQRRFEIDPAREAVQTKALIADIDRIVQIISADIAAQEEEAGVTVPSRPEYPLLGKALRARRDNLLDTIAALERKLTTLYSQTHGSSHGAGGLPHQPYLQNGVFER